MRSIENMGINITYNDLYMKSGGSYSIVRSVHRDSVTSFNVSCEDGDRHFLYTLLGAVGFKLANQQMTKSFLINALKNLVNFNYMG